MSDSFRMKVTDSQHHLGGVHTYRFVVKLAILLEYQLVKLAALDVRHDKIQSQIILKHVFHVDQEGMVTGQHDVFFENMALYTQIMLENYVFAN